MRHVDEGLLQAYADGQLEHFDPAAAREVEAHLASCAGCRGRLDEARALTDRAAGILARSGPEHAEPPPFDALVARAGRGTVHGGAGGLPAGRATAGPRGPRRGRVLPGLAWAASLMLALAGGWYARGVVWGGAEPAALSTVGALYDSVAELRPVLATPPPSAPAPAVDRTAASESARRRAEPASPLPAAGAGSEQERLAAQAPLRELAGRAAPARGAEADSARVRSADMAAALSRHEVRARAVADSTVVPAEQAVLETARKAVAEVEVQARTEPGPGGARLDDAVWTPTGRAEAERRLGASIVLVPGLPTVGIALADSPGGAAVRVTQSLGAGQVLELIQHAAAQPDQAPPPTPPAPAPPGAAPGDEGLATARLRVGNLLVTARAPVSPDSLSVLVSRLR